MGKKKTAANHLPLHRPQVVKEPWYQARWAGCQDWLWSFVSLSQSHFPNSPPHKVCQRQDSFAPYAPSEERCIDKTFITFIFHISPTNYKTTLHKYNAGHRAHH